MANTVGICNRALARIGVSTFIDSIEDDSAEAEACNALFEGLRDTVLSAFPWPFATRREVLAPLEDVERTGWQYVFALPADCLSVRYVYAGIRTPLADQRIPFAIEANDEKSSAVLLCDLEAPELVYTFRADTESIWSEPFADALAWFLAKELAMPLTAKESLQERAARTCEVWLGRAQAIAASEAQETLPDNAFVAARR